VRNVLPRAVMWHYVRLVGEEPRVGYRGVTPEAFATQLDEICGRFEPIGWPAMLTALRGGRRLPSDAVVLTFDDGFADHHRVVLPALAERGLRGVFFVLARRPGDGLTVGHRLHVLLGVAPGAQVRAAVRERMTAADRETYERAEAALTARALDDPDDVWKRPLQRELAEVAGPILASFVDSMVGPEAEVADALHLSPRQLDDLVAAGMTLGGHGREHYWLDAVDEATRRSEIAASAADLTRYGGGPWPFAYPYGGLPPSPRSLLSPAGFAAAFTTVPDQRSDRYRIGRVDGDDPGWLERLQGRIDR
jgi:peptidoglycan/xylan/chitin deacetylase (PgdA/CDA1 family)